MKIHNLNEEVINREPNDILDHPCYTGTEPSPNNEITRILLLEELYGEEVR